MNEQLVYLAQIAIEAGEPLDYWRKKHPGILKEALEKVNYFQCFICQNIKCGKHVNIREARICFACGDEISEKLQELVDMNAPDESQLQLFPVDLGGC